MWCGEIFGIVEIRFYVVSGTSTMFVLFCFAFVFVYIDHLALYTFHILRYLFCSSCDFAIYFFVLAYKQKAKKPSKTCLNNGE